MTTKSAAVPPEKQSTVAVIGCGTIGRSWAICFARTGYAVRLFDVGEGEARRARTKIQDNLEALERIGGIASAAEALERISVAADLRGALADVIYAQESIIEEVAAKASLFAEMDRLAPSTAILTSSTSAIMPSEFLAGVAGRERCLVAHPFNPPHLIPLVEIVPTPWTQRSIIDDTILFLEGLGQAPVLIRKEVPGFVGNRLQAAVVNEAMNLIKQQVISPADLDRCMTYGLGRRWAFLGPFETMDLNAPNGFADYAQKFGASYQQLGTTLGVAEPWAEEAAGTVEKWRRSELPLEQISGAQAERDRLLLSLMHWLDSELAMRPLDVR